jgi:alpha-glucoside transport system substrate-binding protein
MGGDKPPQPGRVGERMMRNFGRSSMLRRALLAAAAGALALAACAPGQSNSSSSGKTGGTVHVLQVWGGTELDSFKAVLKPFEDQTGINVEYESTRDINATLTTALAAGNPPEIAGLPGPGQMYQFAEQGKLVPLDNVLDLNTMKQQYSSSWLQLAKDPKSGKTAGIFMRVSLKGLVWYDPKAFQAKSYQVPTSWSQLMSLSQQIGTSGTTPWCIGLESGAASGWPGSDWIKQIALTQAGPSVYDQWWNGKQKWSSPQIKQAWQTWGNQILGANEANVYGGKQYMVATAFGDAAQPMFQSPPKCYMHGQASFMTSFFDAYSTKPQAGTDYNFFPLPAVDSQYDGDHVVAGDLFGMFKDTPQSRALMKYLTTPEAQAIWVKRGGAISPNKQVPVSDYPDAISKSLAQDILSAKTVKFDAGDLMPSAMQTEYWTGVLNYVNNQSQLDSILAHLDQVQATAYTS